jgi:hypothetical protein
LDNVAERGTHRLRATVTVSLSKTLLRAALVVAGIGLLFSVAFPVITLTELAVPKNAWLWALHAGLVFVWGVIFWSSDAFRRRGIRHSTASLRVLGKNAWVKASILLLLGYALFNLGLFAVGTLLDWFPSGEGASVLIHAFGALWVLFYLLAFEKLYLVLRATHLLSPVYCPQGHRVLRSHTVCLYCGAKIDKDSRAA